MHSIVLFSIGLLVSFAAAEWHCPEEYSVGKQSSCTECTDCFKSKLLSACGLGVASKPCKETLIFNNKLHCDRDCNAEQSLVTTISSIYAQYVKLYNLGDFKRLAEMFHPEAYMYFTAGAVFKGKKEIAKGNLLASQTGKGSFLVGNLLSIHGSGIWAWSDGDWKILSAEKHKLYSGTFLTVWKFQKGGWYIYRQTVISRKH